MIHRHVLSHRDDKGCLPHSRTCGDDDEVRVLPAGGHLVYVVEARCESTNPLGAVSGDLYLADGSLDKGVDRDKVSARVLLCYLEERALRLLDLFLYVDDVIIGSLESRRSHPDETTTKRLIIQDISVCLEATGGHHLGGQASDERRATDLVQHLHTTQLLSDGKHVYGSLCHSKSHHRRVDELVRLDIEGIGAQTLADTCIGILL